MNNPNYYEILEIPTDADTQEIKRAYHRFARELHPDKASSPEEARQLEERFALVSAAYNTLKDESKRVDYDRQFKPAAAAQRSASPVSSKPAVPSATASRSGGPSRPQLGITPEKVAIAQKAFAKGMQFYKEGNYVKAIEFFDAAIQNNDGEAVYHGRLAAALIRARKSGSRAISAAQRAIELDTYNMEHRLVLAEVFVAIGSTTNAAKIYKEILRWDNTNQAAIDGLAGLKKTGRGSSILDSPHLATFKSIIDKFRR